MLKAYMGPIQTITFQFPLIFHLEYCTIINFTVFQIMDFSTRCLVAIFEQLGREKRKYTNRMQMELLDLGK